MKIQHFLKIEFCHVFQSQAGQCAVVNTAAIDIDKIGGMKNTILIGITTRGRMSDNGGAIGKEDILRLWPLPTAVFYIVFLLLRCAVDKTIMTIRYGDIKKEGEGIEVIQQGILLGYGKFFKFL